MAKLPLGLYEQLLSDRLRLDLANLQDSKAEIESLDKGEAHLYISRYIAAAVEKSIRALSSDESEDNQIALANRIISVIPAFFQEIGSESPVDNTDRLTAELLKAITSLEPLKARLEILRPGIPLNQSALLVNAKHEHRIGVELINEMDSADRVDLLCSFLKWGGYVRMRTAFRSLLVDRQKPLRIMTTVYMGATERRVLDELHEMGAQIRVSYDARRTRLHAKAWLFQRESGFDTAYIGSSNLSAAALSEGLEWNVRVSIMDNPHVVRKFNATFDNYWADTEFEDYDPNQDSLKFDQAIEEQSGDYRPEFLRLNVTPYPYQAEILEQLDAERELHKRTHNLVVAATGTGKTVIAALDFKNLWEKLQRPSLLFVAHRKEILNQAHLTFRTVLGDSQFGSLYYGGEKPSQMRHLFASIQSISSKDIESFPKNAFDVVIVDEFHHAGATTYQKLLDHFEPKILLGLTATPERTDGFDILHWFGGHIAAELRLWHAIDRGLLAPFQYFGIDEDTDLSNISWEKGGYNRAQLDGVYTGNHARVRLVLVALRERVANPMKMRALGFCVTKAHANFMAETFSASGIPALSLTSDSTTDERDSAISKLRNKEINVLFTVDLFNEGVDIPELDTLLMLRPTESSLIFLQQLGRGLRLSKGKESLTVLDFIGNAHRNFRYASRFRSLLGNETGSLVRQVESDFPVLPSGCSIQLNPKARDYILSNIKNSIQFRAAFLCDEARRLGPTASFSDFVQELGLDRRAFYSKKWSWSRLRREAGLSKETSSQFDMDLESKLYLALGIDDPPSLQVFIQSLKNGKPPVLSSLSEMERRRWQILVATFDRNAVGASDEFLKELFQSSPLRMELCQLFEWLYETLSHVPKTLSGEPFAAVPLNIHCHYSLVQIMTAFGNVKNGKVHPPQAGVYAEKKTNSDLLFVTLSKSERDYSPNTMYEDYAISPTEFHWQSQHFVTPESRVGLRHIRPEDSGATPLLFVRRTAKDEFGNTNPYQLLGRARPISWSGSRPISVIWKLEQPMPAVAFAEAKVASG